MDKGIRHHTTRAGGQAAYSVEVLVKTIEKECEKFLGVVLGEAVKLRRVLADTALEVARCHGREVARPHPLQ